MTHGDRFEIRGIEATILKSYSCAITGCCPRRLGSLHHSNYAPHISYHNENMVLRPTFQMSHANIYIAEVSMSRFAASCLALTTGSDG